MDTRNKLLHPTPRVAGDIAADSRVEAVRTANRLLQNNGMANIEAFADGLIEKERYYFCQYRNIANPDDGYGGGASLVIRKSDGLGGMVYCMQDWLWPDEFATMVKVEAAFGQFDQDKT